MGHFHHRLDYAGQYHPYPHHTSRARGKLPFHLHFDMTHTGLLGKNPQNWPGTNIEMIRAHYIDPLVWIKEHLEDGMARAEFFDWLKKQADSQPLMLVAPNMWPPIQLIVGDINALRGVGQIPDAPTRKVLVTDDGVRIRQTPDMIDDNIKAAVNRDTELVVAGEPQNGFMRIAEGEFTGCYISTLYLKPA